MKKQRKSAAGQAAHADVYQIVTDRIIAALEQGTAPWRRPWRCVDTGDPGGLPSNALTGRCYSGVNVLLLWLAAEEGGYTSDRWLTYRPATDTIVMPLTSQFDSEADYWSTLLHEMVHSTGHRNRLDREGITSSSRKRGDMVYAFEELIAETGSAYLCTQLGIYGEVQHESYIDSWLRVLRSDKKALFRACSRAREATEYLLAPLSICSAA